MALDEAWQVGLRPEKTKGQLYERHSKVESTQLADLSRLERKNHCMKPKTPLNSTWVYSKFEWPISPLKSPLNLENGEIIVTVKQ